MGYLYLFYLTCMIYFFSEVFGGFRLQAANIICSPESYRPQILSGYEGKDMEGEEMEKWKDEEKKWVL